MKASLRGEVVFTSGERWAGMRIHLVPLVGDRVRSDAELLASTVATVGTRGANFHFEDVARGRYQLGVELSPGRIQARQTVEVGEAAASISVEAGAVPDGDVLMVDCRGPDGAVASDMTASVVVTDGRSAVRQHAYPDIPSSEVSPGRWRFAIPRGPFRSWTRGRVEANWQGHWAQSVEFRPGVDRVVTVTFQSATVEVVADSADTLLPVGLTAVLLDDIGVEPVTFHSAELDRGTLRAGKATIDPVGVGDYDLHVLARAGSKGGGDPRSVVAKRIHVIAGRNLVQITVPSLASIEIARPGKVGGWAQIERAGVSPLLTRWETGTFNPDGVVTFDRYPAGRYVVTAFSSEEKSDGEMLVSLPAQGRVVFEAGRIDSILVRIADPNGALGLMGLRDGDRIVAIDGKTCSSSDEVRAAIYRATAQDSFVADFVRDGARRQATLDGRVVLAELEIGGHLECASSR